jgi:hypothetical protein
METPNTETPRTETPHTEIPRTKSIITIVVLLALLAALSVTSALTSGQFGGLGRARGSFNGTPGPGGGFNGTPGAPGGNFQGGGAGGGAAGGGAGGGGGFGGGGGGGFAGRTGGGGFNTFAITRQLGLSPLVIVYAGIAVTLIGILLLLLCAFGVWKQKKWALNLAMLVALLFLLGALPGFFMGGRFNLLRTAIEVLDVGASAVILVMGILPSVRDSVS